MSNLASFLQGNGVNSLYQKEQDRKNLSRSFNSILSEYSSTMGQDTYLTMKGKIENSSKAKEEKNKVKAIPPSNLVSLLNTSPNKEVMSQIKSSAAKNYVKMMFDLYMVPSPKSDVIYRIGEVKSSIPKNTYLKYNGQLTKEGSLSTRTNFFEKFKIKGYSGTSTDGLTEYTESYVNLFFPPYFGKAPRTTCSSYSTKTNKRVEEKDGKYVVSLEEEKSDKPLSQVDVDSMLNYRGKFTYREPSFKSVNDNINFTQWLFERVSGIVCTYLTEWDLSQYFQENLYSETTGQAPKFISLIHRVGDDGISNVKKTSDLAYGVINACVSKIYQSNLATWNPSDFPLSTYWSSYPNWMYTKGHRDFYIPDEEMVDSDGNPIKIEYPKYVDWADNTRYKPRSVLARLQQDDFLGQATSGFDDWSLQYYKAVYMTPDEGIESPIASLHSDFANEFIKTEDFLRMCKDATYAETEPEASAQMYFTNSAKDKADRQQWLSDNGIKYGGAAGKKKKGIIATIISYMRAGTKKAINTVSDATGRDIREDGTTESALKDKHLKEVVNTETGKKEIVSVIADSPENAKDAALGVGINQRASTLFGGPHGVFRSPLTVQSYFEPNNPFLRDVPRIGVNKSSNEPWTMVENKTPSSDYPGAEKWMTSATAVGNSEIKMEENSFHQGLRNLNGGVLEYTWATAHLSRRYTERVLGYSNGSWGSYISWPSHINGYSLSYFENKWDIKGHSSETYYGPWYKVRKWGWYRPFTKWWLRWIWWYGVIDWWWDRDTFHEYAHHRESWGWAWPTTRQYYEWRDISTHGSQSYWSCHWLSSYEQKPYRWNGSYEDYMGNYFYVQYLGNGGYRGHYIAPTRWATWVESKTIPYKRYYAHSMPSVPWQLTKIQKGDSYVSCSWSTNWWGRVWWWFGGLFGVNTSYSCGVRNVRDEWKLTLGNNTSSVNYIKGTAFRHTREEQECIDNMIAIGSSSSSSMYFLQCDSPWTRFYRGPDNIFKCRCHVTSSYAQWTETRYRTVWSWWGWGRRRRCGSHTESYTVVRSGRERYISVDLSHPLEYYAGTASSSTSAFSNIRINGSDFLQKSRVSIATNGATTAHDPSQLVGWVPSVPYLLGDSVRYSSTGLRGVGLMGFFQGFNTQADSSMFADYSNLRFSGNYGNIPMCNIPWKYFTTRVNSGGTRVIDGVRYTLNSGFITYDSHDLDQALKNSFLNLCLRGSFYPDSEFRNGLQPGDIGGSSFSKVTLDTPFRVLYNQLLYQRSYLEIAKDFFCERSNKSDPLSPYTFDFESLGKSIKGETEGEGIVSLKTLTLSKTSGMAGNDGSTYFGYNRWIDKALYWFPDAQDSTAGKSDERRSELTTKFNTRISIYDSAISTLKPMIQKDINDWSMNQVSTAFNLVDSLSSALSDETIEEFMLAYLNVLYEYRRFFIDKRCNKQDGTLWMCRQLEAATPQVIAASLDVDKRTPVLKSGSEGGDSIPVAGYSVDNSTSDKIKAAGNNISLTDRITTCYVKVEYATKFEYEQYYKLGKDKQGELPTIVKVQPWRYKQTETGRYVTKDGEYVKVPFGEPKYAKRPPMAVYSLISKEWIDNDKNKKYNETVTDEKLKKPVSSLIDDASWPIQWGLKEGAANDLEAGMTDILFDITTGFDVEKMEKLRKLPEWKQPRCIPCACKSSADFWVVEVASSTLPRTDGFKTDIKLKPMPIDGSMTLNDESPINPVEGMFSDCLYPIVEDQTFSLT